MVSFEVDLNLLKQGITQNIDWDVLMHVEHQNEVFDHFLADLLVLGCVALDHKISQSMVDCWG